jgi:hypothetical protein
MLQWILDHPAESSIAGIIIYCLIAFASPIGPNAQLNNTNEQGKNRTGSDAFGDDGTGFIDTKSGDLARLLGSLNNNNGVESTDAEKANLKLVPGAYVANVECRRGTVFFHETLFMQPPAEGNHREWSLLISVAKRVADKCKLAFDLYPTAANNELFYLNLQKFELVSTKAYDPNMKGILEPGNKREDVQMYRYK